MELDDKVVLPGAEGIDLDLTLAGIGSRGIALMIDLAVQFGALFVVGLAASATATGELAILAVATFLIWFGYPALMEALNGGRTLGKAVMGLAVVRTDGTPVTVVGAIIRSVVRTIDALPGVFSVGLLTMFASSRTQRLGDLAAGTLVVRRSKVQHHVGGPVRTDVGTAPAFGGPTTADAGTDPADGATGLPVGSPAGAGSPGGSTVPPEVAAWDLSAVTADETAAIRAFLERRHQLPPEHRQRIATMLAGQVQPKVAGVRLDGGPELLLERIAWAKHHR